MVRLRLSSSRMACMHGCEEVRPPALPRQGAMHAEADRHTRAQAPWMQRGPFAARHSGRDALARSINWLSGNQEPPTRPAPQAAHPRKDAVDAPLVLDGAVRARGRQQSADHFAAGTRLGCWLRAMRVCLLCDEPRIPCALPPLPDWELPLSRVARNHVRRTVSR
jgi:hypothetical protein